MSPPRRRPPARFELPAELVPFDVMRDLAEDELHIEGVSVTGTAPPGLRARHWSLTESRIRSAILAAADLPDLWLREVVVDGADLANAKLRAATFHRVRLVDTRLTGATLSDSTLQDVVVKDCQADFTAFGTAKLERVMFSGCNLGEASFGEARLREVRFEHCDLSRASFHRAALQRVELVSCTLEGVAMAELRGAAMPYADILAAAPELAVALGISALAEEDEAIR